MKKTIKKSYLFIVMLTFMIVLFSSLIASIFIFPKQALALSNPSSAIQVTNVGGGFVYMIMLISLLIILQF